MNVTVEISLCIGADYFIFFLKSMISESFEQIKVIIFEEGVWNDGMPFVFGETGHWEQGLKEQLLPDMIDRGRHWLFRHIAVPVGKLSKQGFSHRVRPYLFKNSKAP